MFSVDMGHKDFTSNKGWLHRFQIRHNIKTSVLSGESTDVKEEVVQEWARRQKDKCEGYALKDIFNADETDLFSLVAREVSCRQRRARAASCQRTD